MSIKKRRLLLITDMFPNEQNQVAGIFVQHQVEALASHFEIQVVSTYFPGKPRISHYHNDKYDTIEIYYPQDRMLYPLTTVSYYRYSIPVIRKVIREWQPEIIHVHDCRHVPELLALSFILPRSKAKKILSVHNIKTLPERSEYKYLKPIYQATLKRCYSYWDHVFFVNEKLRQRMQRIVPLDRSSMLGNAIKEADEDQAQIPDSIPMHESDGDFRILSVGNLVKTKGFDLLIKAVDELRHEGKKISLQIIGSGPEQSLLEKMIASRKLQDAVHLSPAQPNEVIRSLYHHYHAFVLPSYSETFGIVYLEAMDTGLPVIGVKGQGIDGVIRHGVNGLLCQPHDLTDLKAQIKYLIENPELVLAMGSKAKLLVRSKYMMDSLIERIREIYAV